MNHSPQVHLKKFQLKPNHFSVGTFFTLFIYKACILDLYTKNSLKRVSIGVWGFGTKSHICSKRGREWKHHKTKFIYIYKNTHTRKASTEHPIYYLLNILSKPRFQVLQWCLQTNNNKLARKLSSRISGISNCEQ